MYASLEFKVIEYMSPVDRKFILEVLLEYSDNQKASKLKYHSISIDNKENIKFNKFDLKTSENLRGM